MRIRISFIFASTSVYFVALAHFAWMRDRDLVWLAASLLAIDVIAFVQGWHARKERST